jgi:hypothetical protein
MRSRICDHVIEVRQKLWVKERQDPFVELEWTPGGYHVMISRIVRRLVVPIESAIIVVVDGCSSGSKTTTTEIIKAIGTVATTGILEPTRRWPIHQHGLDALGLVISNTSRNCGSLLRIIRIQVLERTTLVVHNTLVVILVVILIRLVMRVTGMIRGDPGGETRGRRPIVVFVVVAVFVVALVRFCEIGGRAGGRCARTRRVLWQASDGSVSPSVSYVRFLYFLYRLVLRGRVGILAIWILGWHVKHQIDGFVVESGRLGTFRQSIELLPLFRRFRVRCAAQPLGEPEAEGEASHQGTEAGAY